MTATPSDVTTRLLDWLRGAVDLALLGLLWMLASLPIVTVVFATTALHSSFVARDRDEKTLLAFVASLRSTARAAGELSLVVVPVLILQGAIVAGLVVWGTAPAVLLLGLVAAISLMWWSLLLVVHSTFALSDAATFRDIVPKAARIWVLSPWRPLLWVILGFTLVAVSWAGFIVAALFIASLPAWLVYAQHPWRKSPPEREVH